MDYDHSDNIHIMYHEIPTLGLKREQRERKVQNWLCSPKSKQCILKLFRQPPDFLGYRRELEKGCKCFYLCN